MVEGSVELKSFIIPAPTKGLNYKEPYPLMDPSTAISMSNLIPNGATVDVRGALEKWATVGAGTSLRGLFVYDCPNGAKYLIGYGVYYNTATSTYWDILYNLSSSTATYLSSYSLGVSSSSNFPDPAPMSVNFGGYLFIITGSLMRLGIGDDVYWRIGYSGTSLSASFVAYPDPGYSDLAYGRPFSTIGVYRNRLYYSCGPRWDDGSTVQKIFYGNSNQVSSSPSLPPADNYYDISYLTKKGGKIIFADSVTRQEGSLSQSLFAVVTENGEMLVFQGSYPGSESWSVVGYYVIPKPLGKRAFFYIGSSLYIITQSGIYSFAELTNNYGGDNQLAFESDYINNKFPDYASYALTLNSLTQGVTSWYGTYYPKENKVFIGYPDSPSTYGMLVQDLTTKGWGQLNYKNQIAGTTVFNNGLYGFAPASYTYQLQGLTGIDDYFNGSTWTHTPISVSAQLAANYNGDMSLTKTFDSVKGLVQCTSPYSITAGVTVDFDLRSAGYNNYSHMSGGTYGLYQPTWQSGDRENVGKCCILNLGGQFTGADLPMKFVAFEVFYKEGGNW